MAEKKKIVVIPDPVITLNDTYQVTLDKRCYVLGKKATSDDKELSKEEQKTGVKILGYFSTWEHLGNSLIKEISREKAIVSKEDKLTITNFLNIVKETNKEVSNMFKIIDKESKIKDKK